MALIAGLATVGVLLAGGAAALSAALSAVARITESQARILVDEGFAGADALVALRADEGNVSALAVFRALCTLAAVVAIVVAAGLVWGERAFWIGGPAAVLAVLAIVEVGPRAVAGRRPVRIALAAAPALRSISTPARRVLFPLLALGRVMGRVSGRKEGTPDELRVREALEIGTGAGIVEDDESRLIERAFKLDELNAWAAMTPRVDILAWPDDRPLGDVMDELERVPHSRIPVYDGTIDEVTGILHVRDAYRAYVAGRSAAPLKDLAREPMFVPGSLSLAKLLAQFRSARVHMGIVADEFGGTDGLITLEDVLEELVGEIVDETDVDEDTIVELSPDEIVASGAADIREINERHGFRLQAGEHRSLNGFILEELGQVPDKGRSFDADGVRIEVVEATDTQVVRARLRRSPSE